MAAASGTTWLSRNVHSRVGIGGSLGVSGFQERGRVVVRYSSQGDNDWPVEPLIVSRRLAAVILPLASTIGGIEYASQVDAATSVRDSAAKSGYNGYSVELRTLNGCGLGVSRYPDFVYNAEGGGGFGSAEELPDGRTLVRFDTSKLFIPTVCFRNTTLLGLPLPPPFRIEVVPQALEGFVDRDTGKVELNFQANFLFSAGPLYHPPPLVVDTILTTESAHGYFRGGTGSRLDSDGNCELVGVARLAPISDPFLSAFLALPTDCIAKMSAQLSLPLV